MRIDPEGLHTGASQLHDAAWLAQEGADQLARTTVGSGIFGSFAAAEEFREAIRAAHDNHAQRLTDHQCRLGVLGDHAHTAASAFTEMEDRNARALTSAQ